MPSVKINLAFILLNKISGACFLIAQENEKNSELFFIHFNVFWIVQFCCFVVHIFSFPVVSQFISTQQSQHLIN